MVLGAPCCCTHGALGGRSLRKREGAARSADQASGLAAASGHNRSLYVSASFMGHTVSWRGDFFTLKDGKLDRISS